MILGLMVPIYVCHTVGRKLSDELLSTGGHAVPLVE